MGSYEYNHDDDDADAEEEAVESDALISTAVAVIGDLNGTAPFPALMAEEEGGSGTFGERNPNTGLKPQCE